MFGWRTFFSRGVLVDCVVSNLSMRASRYFSKPDFLALVVVPI